MSTGTVLGEELQWVTAPETGLSPTNINVKNQYSRRPWGSISKTFVLDSVLHLSKSE